MRIGRQKSPIPAQGITETLMNCVTTLAGPLYRARTGGEFIADAAAPEG
jgi:hypothetical protein